MEFIDTVKKITKTSYISIPIKICRQLDIEEGDTVKINIEKISIVKEKEVEA